MSDLTFKKMRSKALKRSEIAIERGTIETVSLRLAFLAGMIAGHTVITDGANHEEIKSLLASLILTADRVAIKHGIDLGEAVKDQFNKIGKELNLPERM